MSINGTPGNDNLTGTSGDDTFDLSQGGDDTAQGLGGTDLFILGHTLNAADAIDGGDGTDTIKLFGDYTGANALTFAATTIANVEFLKLRAGNFALTMDDGNVGARQSLKVDASALTASQVLTFDGSAESDGHYRVTGGQGNDVLTGGNGPDTFLLVRGGDDTVNGGAGNDTFQMGATLTAADQIDGGTGLHDTVQLQGSYSGAGAVTFGADTIKNIDVIQVLAGHSYTLTSNDANVATGTTMMVDATGLTGTDFVNFNGSAESNGYFYFIGGVGNDTFTGGTTTSEGGNTSDTFDLSHGGNDTATGNGGADTFIMGAAFNAGDRITGSGSGGISTLILDGDYSGASAVVCNSTTFRGINTFILSVGHDYNITESNGNVTSDGGLVVVSRVGAGHTATFDGSAETDGGFLFSAQSGSNTLLGGAKGDEFDNTSTTGTFSVNGGGGNDIVSDQGSFSASDQIDGGTGNDSVGIGTDANTAAGIVFTATTMTNVETLTFDEVNGANPEINLTSNDATVAAGATMTIDNSAGNVRTVIFDGSAETDGHFAFKNGSSGTAFTTFFGGAQADNFNVNHLGQIEMAGNGGADTFKLFASIPNGNRGHFETLDYNAVSDSTSSNYDVITQLNTVNVMFHTSGIGGATTGIDAAVTTGSLSTPTFDSDLATDVGAGQLAAHHAMLFTADAGTLSGHTFLVVDENGTAGYQAGADLVIDVTGATGTLTTANFA
jgi:Ca2+-binding RTX toxin-like protein